MGGLFSSSGGNNKSKESKNARTTEDPDLIPAREWLDQVAPPLREFQIEQGYIEREDFDVEAYKNMEFLLLRCKERCMRVGEKDRAECRKLCPENVRACSFGEEADKPFSHPLALNRPRECEFTRDQQYNAPYPVYRWTRDLARAYKDQLDSDKPRKLYVLQTGGACMKNRRDRGRCRAELETCLENPQDPCDFADIAGSTQSFENIARYVRTF